MINFIFFARIQYLYVLKVKIEIKPAFVITKHFQKKRTSLKSVHIYLKSYYRVEQHTIWQLSCLIEIAKSKAMQLI
jgi:hypothetical protein